MKFDYKKYLKALLIMVIMIITLSLLVNTLYYFDIINNNLVKYFKMIISIVSFFIGGMYLGLHSPNKGYMYGLKLSLFMVLILIMFGIIYNELKFNKIIYYLITTISITFGAMIGINKKKG